MVGSEEAAVGGAGSGGAAACCRASDVGEVLCKGASPWEGGTGRAGDPEEAASDDSREGESV